MKFFLQIFKKQTKDCVILSDSRAFSVRRKDRPAHPPVFSPFCRKWEREHLAEREEEKRAAWDELSRILSFADRRESGEREPSVRAGRPHSRTRRGSLPAEEEFFPELLALRGFNMKERGLSVGHSDEI